ncbi:hypothetical protein [Methylobacter sp. S3L5C]|uniref:hypothetical protein n=1 Tax=Methylobacter sp. S3L5C TaxID=2839024 RepID=UPI001FABDD76|nr:hypothetical protein [Methylobacter sp. S3L5C]UOA07462.1 hypothetical protein KKZ03_14455 [Methylobacter sp. S3L5C]
MAIRETISMAMATKTIPHKEAISIIMDTKTAISKEAINMEIDTKTIDMDVGMIINFIKIA